MSHASPAGQRIISLDQFRGYTVLGMFLVNFVGGFEATHYLLKHHNTFCSYSDTIMPQFLFAVGFAFRLTFGVGFAPRGRLRHTCAWSGGSWGWYWSPWSFTRLEIRAQTWEQLHEMAPGE